MLSDPSRFSGFQASGSRVSKPKRDLNTEACLKLKLRATPQEPRIKAGTLGQAIKEKQWVWWTTAFKI